MQKVIRTIHGRPGSIRELNELLSEGWRIIWPPVLLPAVTVGTEEFFNCLEYVLDDSDIKEKSHENNS